MRFRFYLLSILLSVAACSPKQGQPTQLFPVKVGAQYGFIDKNGKMVIPAQYQEVSRFSDGLALVSMADGKNRWGYTDPSGSMTIESAYKEGTVFSDDIAFVVPPGEAPEAIDKNGKLLFSLRDAEQVNTFHEGLAAVSLIGDEGERWGFIDKTGKTVVSPLFVNASYFSDGFCGVTDETGKWGFISSKGVISIPFHFDNVGVFRNGEAKAMLHGKWGIIDKSGKFILEAEYEDIYPDEDKYLVKKDGNWQWLDKQHKPVFKPVFSLALPFYKSDLAPVRMDSKWGYINAKGNFPVTPQFDFAFCFDGDVALVGSNGKYGLIDKTGMFVSDLAYDRVAVDYLIGTFSNASAFYSVRSDFNSPKHVAYTWLSGFYHLRFDEALSVSSEDTKKLLIDVAGLLNGLDDSSRSQMLHTRIGIKGYDQQGDNATVRYVLSNDAGSEHTLHLIKQVDRWVVQFSPQDVRLEKVPAVAQ